MRETWESLIRDFVRHLKGTMASEGVAAIRRWTDPAMASALRRRGKT
jgi:hypothetical protein